MFKKLNGIQFFLFEKLIDRSSYTRKKYQSFVPYFENKRFFYVKDITIRKLPQKESYRQRKY